MSSQVSAAAKPTLPEVLDKIGFGGAQARSVILAGGVWLADGAELLLISSVTKAVAEDWHLSSYTQSLIVTIVFLGICVGNLVSGPASVYFGRKDVVLASYLGIFVFSILSSFAGNVFWLAGWRFLAGFFIGLGQPASMALGQEITPVSWRLITQALTQSLFPVGEMFTAFLLMRDDPSLLNLNWRLDLQLSALPALVLGLFAACFLDQSPMFLVLKGRQAEATRLLDNMRQQNSAGDFSVEFQAPATEPSLSPNQQAETDSFVSMLSRQLKVITGKKFLVPTLVLALSCFTTNLAFYGCMFAFPQVLSELIHEGTASQLLIGALWEFPGYCIGTSLGSCFLRKPSVRLYFCLLFTALIVFVIGANNGQVHPALQMGVYVGYYGLKVAPIIGFLTLYQISNELYPTEARTAGTGMCLAGGRFGAMFGPMLYTATVEITGSWLFFFLSMAVLSIINLALINFIPETFGSQLDVVQNDDKLHGDKVAD